KKQKTVARNPYELTEYNPYDNGDVPPEFLTEEQQVERAMRLSLSDQNNSPENEGSAKYKLNIEHGCPQAEAFRFQDDQELEIQNLLKDLDITKKNFTSKKMLLQSDVDLKDKIKAVNDAIILTKELENKFINLRSLFEKCCINQGMKDYFKTLCQ